MEKLMNVIYATAALISYLISQFGKAILWVFFIGAAIWLIRRAW